VVRVKTEIALTFAVRRVQAWSYQRTPGPVPFYLVQQAASYRFKVRNASTIIVII
jgi:hypothetical protein